ncbi:HMCN [Mytilus coruscus]|uniref:HMCN n=1 Tax=Mytilus coruscus TaxID=42192 RepID=A0A6J8F286_MYTCO|nr:HMCN [Mytilus coruscus]
MYLIKIGIPKVEITSVTQLVEYGQPFTLDCNIKSFPNHTYVYWQRLSNGTTSNITSDYPGLTGITTMFPSVTILKAVSTDSGLYTCYAENIVGTGYSDAVNVTVIGDIPKVEITSVTQLVEYGQPFTLDCNITSFPNHTSVYWKRMSNGTTSNITSDYPGLTGITTMFPSMTIMKAVSTDSGLYSCVAVNIVGTGSSDAVNVTVIGGIPKVEITSVTQIVEYGQPFTLDCNISSFPNYTSVYWQRMSNGTTSDITSDYVEISYNITMFPSMTILKAVSVDSGLYICYAENIVGTGYSDAVNVTVIGGYPSVVVDRNLYIVEYGNNITLRCTVESIPTFIHIYWQKISSEMATNFTTDTIGVNDDTVVKAKLFILEGVPSDSGLYTCYAVNIAGTGQSDSINLTIYGGIPTVTAESDSFDIQYGQNHTIKCRISSTPAHTEVFWHKISNGIKTNITSYSPGYSGATLTNPSLTIFRANSDDSGEYICYALNVAGRGMSNSINITVFGKENDPIVEIESNSYIVRFGDPLTIKCFVLENEDYPVRNIHWEYDNNGELTNITAVTNGVPGSTKTMSSISIEVFTTINSGLYTCYATNKVGTRKSKPINVTVIGGLPIVKVPKNNYTSWYSDNVTLMCNVSADPPVRFVYWKKEFNDRKNTVINRGSIGIDGISPDVPSLTLQYSTQVDSGVYRCFATNDVGTSSSESLHLQVIGEKPSVSVSVNSISVKFGDQATLVCNVDSELPLNIVYWEKKSKRGVTRISSWTIGTNGSSLDNPSLTILFTTSTDSGHYTCFAGNVVGKNHSSAIHFTVIGEKPSVNVSVNSLSVKFGDQAKLECSVDSKLPLNIVYWEKKSNSGITRISSWTIGTNGSSLDNPSLTILYTTSTDSGHYTCFAGNVVGKNHSSAINFTVIGGLPVVSIGSAYLKTIYGQAVTIECNVMADPPATFIFWRRNTSNIVSTLYEGTVGTYGISIIMPSVVLTYPTTEDSGSYTCFALNSVGTQQSSPVTLLVEGDIPVVTVESEQYIANFGDSITLQCEINAIPSYKKFFWYKNVNENTTVIDNGTSGITLQSPSLTIIFAAATETGRYTCLAENAAGIDIPEVIVPFETYKTGVDYSVTLICRIKAVIPTVTKVYWQRYINNATAVILSGSTGIGGVTLDNPSLTILSAKESMSGEYTCFAINSVGTGSSLPTSLKVESGFIATRTSVNSDTSESNIVSVIY